MGSSDHCVRTTMPACPCPFAKTRHVQDAEPPGSAILHYRQPSERTWRCQCRQELLKALIVVLISIVPILQSQPDAGYAAALPSLLKAPNAKFIGYVSTQYGDRDPKAVTADVTTYSKWDAKYKLDGIFFDEMQDGKFSQYKGYKDATKAAFGDDAFVSGRPHSQVEDETDARPLR